MKTRVKKSLCSAKKIWPMTPGENKKSNNSFMDGGRRSGLLFRQVQFLFNN